MATTLLLILSFICANGTPDGRLRIFGVARHMSTPGRRAHHTVVEERLKEVATMGYAAGFTSTGAILVLFILLVIVSRTILFC
jgi:hypothetical protein